MTPARLLLIVRSLFSPWRNHATALLLLAAGGVVHVTGQAIHASAGPPTYAVEAGNLAPEVSRSLGAAGFAPAPPGSRPDLLVRLSPAEGRSVSVEAVRLSPGIGETSLRAARTALSAASARVRARLSGGAGIPPDLVEPLRVDAGSPLAPRTEMAAPLAEGLGTGKAILAGIILQVAMLVAGQGLLQARQAGRLEALVPTTVSPREHVAALLALAFALGCAMSAAGLAAAAFSMPNALHAWGGQLAATLALPPTLAVYCTAVALAAMRFARAPTAARLAMTLAPLLACAPLLATSEGGATGLLAAMPFQAAVQAMAGAPPAPWSLAASWATTAALAGCACALALVPASVADWGRSEA